MTLPLFFQHAPPFNVTALQAIIASRYNVVKYVIVMCARSALSDLQHEKNDRASDLKHEAKPSASYIIHEITL